MIYANTEKIAPEQEKALLEYVEGGGGFAPIHCASYCFLNSPKYIASSAPSSRATALASSTSRSSTPPTRS